MLSAILIPLYRLACLFYFSDLEIAMKGLMETEDGEKRDINIIPMHSFIALPWYAHSINSLYRHQLNLSFVSFSARIRPVLSPASPLGLRCP
jgi:hypothetical protein